ncbi:DUF2637 domain-containing protein [Couchioplanes caeruleus]|uniref:DUF2637 domain-containing protein n=2 Tax=Couchioplanes caeruleus TaxID=56438 RepID=A0A1K0GPQ1_9ACTN|nr:DUF2637 domain-containing protein [Couchioplanes caeruleus]OJF13140.1 hypothetical protein BG844_16850 [Couchioplanes caeruleus subsp. caeruleus]ROP28116.1 uncharacterized protein DUF2637 [Couchioplanes caeruleus]
MSEARLRRLRWAVRLTLALGVAASVTANILHARPHPVSQAIAAWPPLALLITVELVSRIPLYRRSLGVLRITATAAIAGIAAWVSYWHMAGVVARYGETGTVPYLLPLSVDGLIVVASVSLVELSARHRDTTPAAPAPGRAGAPATTTAASATPEPEPGLAAATPATAPPVRPAHAELTDGVSDDRPPAIPAPDPASAAERGQYPDGQDDEDDATDDDSASEADDEDDADDGADLAADLVPLLPAARAARDELTREGRTVSRDALARRLRRNGTAIRNNRVSELLTALRREEPSVNGSRPKLPV